MGALAAHVVRTPVKGVGMSLFKIFDVSGSAISAQSQRLNVVASNLANAESIAGADGQPYKARQVVFQTQNLGTDPGAAGVRVTQVVQDNTPAKIGRASCRERVEISVVAV